MSPAGMSVRPPMWRYSSVCGAGQQEGGGHGVSCCERWSGGELGSPRRNENESISHPVFAHHEGLAKALDFAIALSLGIEVGAALQGIPGALRRNMLSRAHTDMQQQSPTALEESTTRLRACPALQCPALALPAPMGSVVRAFCWQGERGSAWRACVKW